MSKIEQLFHDNNFFPQKKINHTNLEKFIFSIKNQIVGDKNKIIYERTPRNIVNKINPDKERYITSLEDKVLVFSISKPSEIALVWYSVYNKEMHSSVYNGKSLIIDSKLYSHIKFFTKTYYKNLFSIIVSNFSNYNVKNFFNQHESFNVNKNYNIL